MKATIVFETMPDLRVEGQSVGRIQQIDLDLKDDGTIAIDKLHVHDRHRTRIPSGLPGVPGVLAPWEENKPPIPDHPRVNKIPQREFP